MELVDPLTDADLLREVGDLSDAELQALIDADEVMGDTSSCCSSGATTAEEEEDDPLSSAPSSPGGRSTADDFLCVPMTLVDAPAPEPLVDAPVAKALRVSVPVPAVPQPPPTAFHAGKGKVPVCPMAPRPPALGPASLLPAVPMTVPFVPAAVPAAVPASTTVVEAEVSMHEQPRKKRRHPAQQRTAEQRLAQQLERRRRNKESADRSRLRKQELLDRLPKEKAELQGKVAQLEKQLAAANAENASLKEQNAFLRSLVTGHALVEEGGAVRPPAGMALPAGAGAAAGAPASTSTGMALAAFACLLTVHQFRGLIGADDEDVLGVGWAAAGGGNKSFSTAAPHVGRVLLGEGMLALAGPGFGATVYPVLQMALLVLTLAWAAPRLLRAAVAQLADVGTRLPLFCPSHRGSSPHLD